MKDLNNVANEISKNKNLEMNLPRFANSMMSLYNGIAYIKLSMNYYTYYDMLNEKEFEDSGLSDLKGLLNRLNLIIKNEVINDTSVETSKESVQEIDHIRNEIIKIMNIVTTYVDRLRIYEYILNRVEFKFSEEEFDEEYYMNHLTNDIMHYIISDKDSYEVNRRISEIVGQLPIRMSKSKFFSYVTDAFSIYHGAQKGTINDFVYNLRTSAMLHEPEGFDGSFEDVHQIYQDLKNADYKNITQEQFKALSDKLCIVTEKMNSVSELFFTLQELVNDVYTIILSKMYAFNDVEEVNRSKYVIKSTLDGFAGEDYNSEDEKLIECFTSFEGQQERIISVVTQNEYVIDLVLKDQETMLQSLMLSQEYQALSIITKLQSGSDFMSLFESEEKEEICSDEYIDQACDSFISELEGLFKESSQIVNRAVMSTVLSQIPVFFNNIDEIQNYINSSLLQCNDQAEKMACVEVINILINGDN